MNGHSKRPIGVCFSKPPPVQHTCRTMWRPRFLTEPYEKHARGSRIGPAGVMMPAWASHDPRLTTIHPHSALLAGRPLAAALPHAPPVVKTLEGKRLFLLRLKSGGGVRKPKQTRPFQVAPPRRRVARQKIARRSFRFFRRTFPPVMGQTQHSVSSDRRPIQSCMSATRVRGISSPISPPNAAKIGKTQIGGG